MTTTTPLPQRGTAAGGDACRMRLVLCDQLTQRHLRWRAFFTAETVIASKTELASNFLESIRKVFNPQAAVSIQSDIKSAEYAKDLQAGAAPRGAPKKTTAITIRTHALRQPRRRWRMVSNNAVLVSLNTKSRVLSIRSMYAYCRITFWVKTTACVFFR